MNTSLHSQLFLYTDGSSHATEGGGTVTATDAEALSFARANTLPPLPTPPPPAPPLVPQANLFFLPSCVVHLDGLGGLFLPCLCFWLRPFLLAFDGDLHCVDFFRRG